MADLASSYLGGVRAGESIGDSLVGPFVEKLEKNRGYKQRMAELAQERSEREEDKAADRLTPEQIAQAPALRRAFGAPDPAQTEDLAKWVTDFKKSYPKGVSASAAALATTNETRADVSDKTIAAREQAAADKAQADLETKNPKITDVDRENYKIAYGHELPKSMDRWSAATQKEVADLVKQKGKPPSSAAENNLSDDEQKAVDKALAEGRIAPTQINARGPKLKTLAQEFIKNPSYNAVESDAGMRRATAQATVQGGEGQKIGAAAGSMDDMMKLAAPLMKDVSPSDISVINGALQAGKNQINDPKLKQVYTYLNSAAGFYATMTKNGGTPDREEREAAMKVISSKLSEGGFAAVQEALGNEAKSRVSRVQGAGFQEKPTAAVSAAAAAAGGVKHDALLDKYGVP